MKTITLSKGSDIVVLNNNGQPYVASVSSAGSTFTEYPGANSVTPDVELYTMTDDEDVEVDESKYITDDLSQDFVSIVGGRPRNVVNR